MALCNNGIDPCICNKRMPQGYGPPMEKAFCLRCAGKRGSKVQVEESGCVGCVAERDGTVSKRGLDLVEGCMGCPLRDGLICWKYWAEG
jgi:hypothetical protein